MVNVLYEKLPESYNGYSLDTSYQTAIQINNILSDIELTECEAVEMAVSYLFNENIPPQDIWLEALAWWLNGWSHDNSIAEDNNEPVMDFNIDQWRIVSAFRSQYGIDLTDEETDMHWWVFMGLLSTLDECRFTQVCEIRSRKTDSKMSNEEKNNLKKLKEVYKIQSETEKVQIEQEKAAILRKLEGLD